LFNRKLWIYLSAALIIAGLAGAVNVVVNGEHAMGTNNHVPWGALIAGYVFFVVSSTGLSLVASLGHVFKLERFEVIGKRAVLGSILTLVFGFVVIGLELGHPFNMVYLLFSANLTSAIFWMGLLYGIYLVLLIFELYFMFKGDHKKSTLFGLLVFISAIAAHSNLGAVFGFLVARPYWSGPYMSIYFILSALLSGSAILSVMFYIVGRNDQKREDFIYRNEHIVTSLGKLLALFLGITMFFTIWKVLTGLYGAAPGKYEAIMALLNGPLSGRFWLFEVLLGMVLPFVVLMTPGGFKLKRVFAAGLMTITGIFVMRLDLVAAGQIIPHEFFAGASEVGYNYSFISWSEWAIILGAIGGTILLYLVGEKKWNLDMDDVCYKHHVRNCCDCSEDRVISEHSIHHHHHA